MILKTLKNLSILVVFALAAVLCSSFFSAQGLFSKRLKFPYKREGLTERQAAAHLLSRFTFGAKPGDVDAVVNMGLENWFKHQLNADLPEDTLSSRLSSYDALDYTNKEVADRFPIRPNLYSMAVKDGFVSRDSLYTAVNKKAFNDQINAYMKLKGLRPEQELSRQFTDQKILRAVYANNQLREVLTDFWFNHFNVSYAKNGPGRFIPAYERDAIRANVFGRFDSLLLSTARSPAMLLYLDNVNSVAPQPVKNVVASVPVPQPNRGLVMGIVTDTTHKMPIAKPQPRRNVQGLNENYAREVMELHTLGVDGGYTQQDVTQVARVLTGWTIFPANDYSPNAGLLKQYQKLGEDGMSKQGYVHDGDFVFIPSRHDKGEKTVLGHHFDGTGGYQEGVDMLEMLAHHPSTARFICKKIAVRFVCDNPPVSLLDKMSKTFLDNDGDIKQVLITMVNSPEFWGKEAVREKTKSPFELAISALRAVNADVKQPRQIYLQVAKMGEPLYNYLAPTGFPDKGQYWINTGSLLSRMNFGLNLAAQNIPGIKFNLLALNNNHEPESAQDALMIYSKLLMPERNINPTVKMLSPLLNDPAIAAKLDNIANNRQLALQSSMADGNGLRAVNNDKPATMVNPSAKQLYAMQNKMLAQVTGIIIGSPEYQRR